MTQSSTRHIQRFSTSVVGKLIVDSYRKVKLDGQKAITNRSVGQSTKTQCCGEHSQIFKKNTIILTLNLMNSDKILSLIEKYCIFFCSYSYGAQCHLQTEHVRPEEQSNFTVRIVCGCGATALASCHVQHPWRAHSGHISTLLLVFIVGWYERKIQMSSYGWTDIKKYEKIELQRKIPRWTSL